MGHGGHLLSPYELSHVVLGTAILDFPLVGDTAMKYFCFSLLIEFRRHGNVLKVLAQYCLLG